MFKFFKWLKDKPKQPILDKAQIYTEALLSSRKVIELRDIRNEKEKIALKDISYENSQAYLKAQKEHGAEYDRCNELWSLYIYGNSTMTPRQDLW